jgi:hypothetical protein
MKNLKIVLATFLLTLLSANCFASNQTKVMGYPAMKSESKKNPPLPKMFVFNLNKMKFENPNDWMEIFGLKNIPDVSQRLGTFAGRQLPSGEIKDLKEDPMLAGLITEDTQFLVMFFNMPLDGYEVASSLQPTIKEDADLVISKVSNQPNSLILLMFEQ